MKYCIIVLFCIGTTCSLSAQHCEKRQQALKVLEESINYLSLKDSWNRKDDRNCEDDSSTNTYSLYCALYQSQVDVTGHYKHRGLVMKTIRKVIRGKVHRRYPHIIRDYNNLDSTSLDDIKQVIKEAITLIQK